MPFRMSSCCSLVMGTWRLVWSGGGGITGACCCAARGTARLSASAKPTDKGVSFGTKVDFS
jgi:hypothetical protein